MIPISGKCVNVQIFTPSTHTKKGYSLYYSFISHFVIFHVTLMVMTFYPVSRWNVQSFGHFWIYPTVSTGKYFIQRLSYISFSSLEIRQQHIFLEENVFNRFSVVTRIDILEYSWDGFATGFYKSLVFTLPEHNKNDAIFVLMLKKLIGGLIYSLSFFFMFLCDKKLWRVYFLIWFENFWFNK